MEFCKNGKKIYKESKRLIKKAQMNKQLVLFVGAGASVDSGMPLWKDAVAAIATKMVLVDGQRDYLLIPQYYFIERGKKEYTQLMREIFHYEEELFPTKLHEKILDFQTETIITTNYDCLLEKAAEQRGEFLQVISQDIDLPYRKKGRELIKMHGDFEHDNFVLKEDDYLQYSFNFQLIETYIKTLIGVKTVLFIGYSLSDPDIKQIISWVKQTVGQDFQRAYIILTNTERNEVERQYFKNLGINIIYSSELIEDWKGQTHTTQLIAVLEYLLDREEDTKLNELLKQLKPLNEFNYVYGGYIRTVLRKNNIWSGESDSLNLTTWTHDEQTEELIKQINKFMETGDYTDEEQKNKLQLLKGILEKSVFRCMEIESKDINKHIDINRTKSMFWEKIFEFDYQGLHELLKRNEFWLIPGNPEVYLQQAYINMIFKNYKQSYNYLKCASGLYYKKRKYIWYFIIELDRKYVGEILIGNSYYFNMNEQERKKIEFEVNSINLDNILKSIPILDNNENAFLKDLKEYNIISSMFYGVYEDSQKTKNEAKTSYYVFSGEAAYERLRINIKDFCQYITCNYMFLDKYAESEAIFDLYVRSIVTSANAVDIISWEHGEVATSNIKVAGLSDFDLYLILCYIKPDRLISIFKEYGIETLQLDKSGSVYINMVADSLFEYDKYIQNTMIVPNRVWTYLVILGHIDIELELKKKILKRLVNAKILIQDIEKINVFVMKICDSDQYDTEMVEAVDELIKYLLEGILEGRLEATITENLIYNLMYLNFKNKKPFKDANMVNRLIKKGKLDILNNNYRHLASNLQRKITTKYSEWKPEKNVKSYRRYCKAVLEGIILESRNMEQEIYEWIETREIAAKDGESVYCGIMPDYVDILSRLVTLFTVGKIEDKKSLKLIVNRVGDERLKWLMDMENYDYTLFECKWLEWCSQKVLNSITSNQAIRQKILEIYREQYRLRKTTSGVNDIIVQYFLV